jgi:hypothetical protein
MRNCKANLPGSSELLASTITGSACTTGLADIAN